MNSLKNKKSIKLITLIIMIIVIASGVSVYATATYFANQITYKDGKTVEYSLNELYTRLTTYKNLDSATTAAASDIMNGKTAYNSNGQLITGTYTDQYWLMTTVTHEENATIDIDLGFTPSFVLMTFQQRSDRFIYSVYDSSKSSKVLSTQYGTDGNVQGQNSEWFIIEGTHIKGKGISGYAMSNSYVITVIARR